MTPVESDLMTDPTKMCSPALVPGGSCAKGKRKGRDGKGTVLLHYRMQVQDKSRRGAGPGPLQGEVRG